MRVSYITDASGDWCGLYVNGELVDEGHSLDPWRVLTALHKHQGGLAIKMLNDHEINMEELGLTRLPQRFLDLWVS